MQSEAANPDPSTRPAHRRKRAIVAALLLATAASLPMHGASGQQPTVLVELFTSEGCSSCPPADALLAELDRKQPVPGTTIIVISEHVDYWNQLGWRDPFSSHQWSERQDEYSRQFHLDSVYTPQMVVDGTQQVNGSDSRAVVSAVEESALHPHVPIAITNLTQTGGTLQVTFTAGSADRAVLYAVIADDADHSSVARGENAGRTLQHVAVARSLARVANLKNMPLEQTTTIALPSNFPERHLRLILFARDSQNGHIVGAIAREL